jgi:hypothetical protein
MNKIKFLITLFLLTFSSSTVYAEEAKTQEVLETKMTEPAEFQKVIDDYKTYVAKIPAEIRQEIIAYRIEIAKLNKEKRALYNKLSQAGQEYLKKEQQYKKKLPLNRKNLINVETPGEKPAKGKK